MKRDFWLPPYCWRVLVFLTPTLRTPALYRDLDASSGPFLVLDRASRATLTREANRTLRLDQARVDIIVDNPESLICQED